MGAVLITAAAAGLLLVAVLLARKLSSKPIHGLPVAPGAHWLLGNINLFMDYYNASLAWAKTLGQNICVVHPMAGPSLLTTSAAVVEGIFKDRQLSCADPSLQAVFKPFFKYGMICLNGDMWRKHVRVLGPMLAVPRLKASVPIMTGAAKAVETKWRSQVLLAPDQPLDVSADLMSVSLAVIGEFVIGRSFAGDSVILKHCAVMMKTIDAYESPLSKLYRALFGDPPDAREAKSFLRSLILEVMAECRRSPEVQDNCAIGQILAAIEKEGVEFSDEELLDEVVMIVFASHDTTATSLMWFLKLLARFPEVQDKLRAELHAVLPKGTDPTYDDITTRLPYLDLCVKELMRLAPISAAISRSMGADSALPGRPEVQLKNGMSVCLATAAMHRLPAYWVEPDRLWPERWEEGAGKGQAAHGLPINHAAYAPFGVGQRACFGSRLATLELKVLLCQLVRAFKFLPTGNAELDGDENVTVITTKPKHNLVKCVAL